MPAILITEPFVTKQDALESTLVPETALQTATALRGNSFVQRQVAGTYSVAPATPTDGSLKTGLGFALEPGHNYAAALDTNTIEVQGRDAEIEINLLTANATLAQISPGAQYGLSIDGATGHYVLDSAKTAHVVMEVVGLAGRGQLLTGDQPTGGSGGVGDVNPRVIARFITTAASV